MAGRPEVVVLGGGISGLVAALELAERGMKVKLFEGAPHAGGRTSSWTDAQGLDVDSGLHVIASHYFNFLEVLRHTGADRTLRWWDTSVHLRKDAAAVSWKSIPLPAPFHLFGTALKLPTDPRTRAGLMRATLDTSTRTLKELEPLDSLSYAAWLRSHGIPGGWVHEIADTAADAATFLTAEDASARAVLTWIKLLTRNASAWDLATWTVPMSDGLVAPLVAAIRRAGGEVHLSTAVVGFESEGSRITGVRVQASKADRPCWKPDGSVDLDGEPRVVPCDFVINAMPMQALRKAMPRELAKDAGLDVAFDGLTTAPALSIRVWFDRVISPGPKGCPLVSGGLLRDFLDVSYFFGESWYPQGSVYELLMGRAHDLVKEDDASLVAKAVAELKQVWPAAHGAVVVKSAVEKIGAAMIAAVPGAYAKRPLAATRLSNFFVGGDWAKHEMSSSMEGATVAGRLAVNALLSSIGERPVHIHQVPEEPVMAAAQWLGKRWRAMTGTEGPRVR